MEKPRQRLDVPPPGWFPVARRRPRQPARVSRSSGTLGDRHVPSGRDQRSPPASLGRAGLQGDAPGDGFVQAAVGGERRVVDLRDGRPDRLDLFLVTGLLAHPRGRLVPRRGRRQRLPHPAVEHAARRRQTHQVASDDNDLDRSVGRGQRHPQRRVLRAPRADRALSIVPHLDEDEHRPLVVDHHRRLCGKYRARPPSAPR